MFESSNGLSSVDSVSLSNMELLNKSLDFHIGGDIFTLSPEIIR